jgi:hypothetical protein
MGKGSKRRPMKIKREEFNENWDRIFGNKKSCGGLPPGFIPEEEFQKKKKKKK